MSNLPQELIDSIVDKCSESREDLRNLSLVSRSWLTRARYHLFRSITLAPQDPKEIHDYHAYLKRKASSRTSPGTQRYYDPLSTAEIKSLQSSLVQKPQNLLLEELSIPDSIRELRLDSSIRIGGGRKVAAAEYLQRWLGFGTDPSEDCMIARDLKAGDDIYEVQQERWSSIDLPWGHYEGLHLPFRNLRYLHIQWSVFSWICPFDLNIKDDAQIPAIHWPGYQFGVLLKASGETLEHISVDEYPGFRLEPYADATEAPDALLDLLAQNVPNLRSLSLGGLMLPRRTNPLLTSGHGTAPYPSRPFPTYPSGDEVPPVFSTSDENISPKPQPPSFPSLERFFLRGFESESTVLIEDSLLNRSRLIGERTKYLSLSAMPVDYDYKILFSALCHSLIHLTLDLDKSILTMTSRFKLASFPQLQCLQLIIDPTFKGGLHDFTRSLYTNSRLPPSDSQSYPKLPRLHIGFVYGRSDNSRATIIDGWRSGDYYLDLAWKDEFFHVDKRLHKMAKHKLELVTVDLPERVLEEILPRTFQTGCLKFQETDDWWSSL